MKRGDLGYETITAPAEWRDRLIGYSNVNTGGVTALCWRSMTSGDGGADTWDLLGH
jgi:hypothetical protein